eukprot:6108820-Alexandrium_andersonii.AAC.1
MKRLCGAWRWSGFGWMPSSVRSFRSPLRAPSRSCRLRMARAEARVTTCRAGARGPRRVLSQPAGRAWNRG